MAKKDELANEKLHRFILLDESVLTYGFRALVAGVDISQFKRNPVFLSYHYEDKLPIGRCVKVWKEDKQILIDVEFDDEDTDEEVQRIIGKVERGFIKMVSAGLTDLVFNEDPKLMLEGQTYPTIIGCRLREASIVSIGANHNALHLYDNEGLEIDLSDEIKLADLIKPYKPDEKMNKELLTGLKLSDDATPAQIEAAVKVVLADNKTLKGDNATLTGERDGLQTKLDEIELADKTTKLANFKAELAVAFKDGRLNADADGKVEERWLKAHDTNPGDAAIMLSELPKRKAAFQDLPDGAGGVKLSAMDKRRQEISENNKK